MHTPDTHTHGRGDRPLGFWLRAVDHLIAREIDVALADEPVDRRHWRALNRVDGSAAAPVIDGTPDHLAHLAELGWIALDDHGWSLTDSGRAAKERLERKVAAVRSRVAGSVPSADFEVTLRTLEAIARQLGWSESDDIPEAPDHPRRGHGHGMRPHPRWGRHLGEPGHPFRRGRLTAQHAFERGFLAGFERGRAA
ncbi:hypothetical protein [Microbacterium sp. Marseille-Q6965]|uniref:hypothetical protein n=1 Tax=Microbacterium sp. Marseille-Q6965 TaxID=2965072 RepID=UPI0021B7E4A4|nr:hypothetical protein [Microbacterium sp. Marseille-Q6965]